MASATAARVEARPCCAADAHKVGTACFIAAYPASLDGAWRGSLAHPMAVYGQAGRTGTPGLFERAGAEERESSAAHVPEPRIFRCISRRRRDIASPAAMPRSLARLRYRASAPRTLPSARRTGDQKYVRGVEEYVQRQSVPGQFRLQFVVNPKSRRQPTGQSVPPPRKPFTLRDVVDPEGTTRHGQLIYVFRNTKSNQIIYSLAELLDVKPQTRFTGLATDARRTTTSHNYPSLEDTRNRPSCAQTNGRHTASSPSPRLSKATMPSANCASSGSCTSWPGTRHPRNGKPYPSRNGSRRSCISATT